MWAWFHHPDVSVPVVRRKTTETMLDLLAGMGCILLTRGRSALVSHCFPNQKAYRAACWRLKRKGWMAYVRSHDGKPVLQMTAAANQQRLDRRQLDSFWNRRWNGIWYLLTYDVPEKQACYRASLRKRLVQLHMGCLKQSTWITPRDIRPEFDDLTKAAGLGDFAVLFEAKTVLGMDPVDIVQAAWPMERLHKIQQWYAENTQRLIRLVVAGQVSPAKLLALAVEDVQAFRSAMSLDPLLPKALWPPDYLGRAVADGHDKLQTEMAKRL